MITEQLDAVLFNSTQPQKQYGGSANSESGSDTQQYLLFGAEMIILEKICNTCYVNILYSLIQKFCSLEKIPLAFTLTVIRNESL